MKNMEMDKKTLDKIINNIKVNKRELEEAGKKDLDFLVQCFENYIDLNLNKYENKLDAYDEFEKYYDEYDGYYEGDVYVELVTDIDDELGIDLDDYDTKAFDEVFEKLMNCSLKDFITNTCWYQEIDRKLNKIQDDFDKYIQEQEEEYEEKQRMKEDSYRW